MSDNEKRVRVERGLYRRGRTYFACATPRGSRKPLWKSLGTVGLLEARRLRDEWAVEVRRGAPRRARPKRATALSRTATVADVADDALRLVDELVEREKLADNTRVSYRTGVIHHVKPWFDGRIAADVEPDDIADWVYDQQESCNPDTGEPTSAWTIRARWTALRLVFTHALRHGLILSHPADALQPHERPGPGLSRLRFLNDDEIERLFKHTDTNPALSVHTGHESGQRSPDDRPSRPAKMPVSPCARSSAG